MEKLKPVVLLETFSKRELKSFDNFLSYELRDKSPGVRNFWSNVYSKQKNKLDFLSVKSYSRKVHSDFNKVAEKFLILSNLEKDKFSSSTHLTRELRIRGVTKYFEKETEFLNDVKKLKHSDSFTDTVNRLKINREEFLLRSAHGDNKKILKLISERIFLTEILVIQSVLSENFIRTIYGGKKRRYSYRDLFNLNRTLAFVRKNGSYFRKRYPFIWVLYMLNVPRRGIGTDFIVTLSAFLQDNEENLSEENLQLSYDALFEIIVERFKSGCSRSFRLLYEIISGLDKKELLCRFEFITPRLFVTLVSVALEFNDEILADNLIIKLGKKLNKSGKDSLAVCLAMKEFHTGNFVAVKELLNGFKSKDPVLYIFHKTVLMKACYETGDFRNIYPLSDTVRHYVLRKKEINSIFVNVNLFLSALNKLVKIRRNEGKNLRNPVNVVPEDRLFFHKNWILEKYKDLELRYHLS
ncbi:MAG: hypothetical protein LWX07_06410 [Bacteroidetes bacterium]|nr:hypothetical protein [Bacteroidota bacterium]